MSRFRDFYITQDSPRWLQLHNPAQKPWLFTASVIPSIVGLGYDSASKVYDLMKAIKSWKFEENNPAIAWGKDMEPKAIAEFLVKYPFCGVQPGLLYHPTIPHLAASLDHFLIHKTEDWMINMEVKCPWSSGVPEEASQIPAKWLMWRSLSSLC